MRLKNWMLIGAALLAPGFVNGAVEAEDRLTRSAKVSPGGTLTVDAEYGSIEVQPGAGNSVEIEVYRKVEAPDRQEADRILKDFDLQVRQTGNDVQVTGVFKDGWKPQREVRRGDRRICRDNECLDYAEYLRRHHYTIRLPKQFNVDLTTRSGSVAVGDLDGSAKSKTSGGSLSFGRIQGPISGYTSGGSVTLRGSGGPADIRTSGGSVHIGDVSGEVLANTSGGSIHVDRAGGRVIAKTSGGNIEVKESTGAIEASTSGGSINALISTQPQADCRLTTSGGNITVRLVDNVRLELDASTSGGRVNTEFPVTLRGKIDPRHMQTAINGGGPLLYLRTSGGSIHLLKSAGDVAQR